MVVFQGGCLCGAVRYATTGEPVNQRICHCSLCQKAIGAAFNARVLMRIEDVTITGEIGAYYSSETLQRCFCQRCGATVFSRRTNVGLMGLTAGTLDDPSLFKPDMHFWTSSKQPWPEVADGLPQYAEGPPT